MKILYIGDVMGEMGIMTIEEVMPELRRTLSIDLVIAQAENVSDGKGINLSDFNRLSAIGVDFFTGGNWTLAKPEIIPLLDDPNKPIIRPANYPLGTAGLGYKYAKTSLGQVLIISLLGQIVGRDADKLVDNPLLVVDQILKSQASVKKIGCVVNFHGDYSSEKVVIGHYLDGRVTMVVGDHWHVPTADARVLPGGTAHITDVGMCGVLNSSLGVAYESVIPRWRDGTVTTNKLSKSGPRQFNAVLVKADKNGLAQEIKYIQRYI